MLKVNVLVISRNSFVLEGLKELIITISSDVNPLVIVSIRDENELNELALAHAVDVIIFAECNHDMVGISWYHRISELRNENPKMKVILCSSVRYSNAYRFRGLIDSFFFLNKPLSTLQVEINRLITIQEEECSNKKTCLSIMEWVILKEVKTGARMQQISNQVNIPYRKVSLLKNNAMRKLGLRNKAELLVFLSG